MVVTGSVRGRGVGVDVHVDVDVDVHDQVRVQVHDQFRDQVQNCWPLLLPWWFFSPVRLGQGSEAGAVDFFFGGDGDAAGSDRAQGGGPFAPLKQRSFTQHRARRYLGHLIAVDQNLEDAVEQQIQVVSRRPLLAQRLAHYQALDGRLLTLPHDDAGQLPFQCRLHRMNDGR